MIKRTRETRSVSQFLSAHGASFSISSNHTLPLGARLVTCLKRLAKPTLAIALSALLVAGAPFCGARPALATPSLDEARAELDRLYSDAEQTSEHLNETAVQLQNTQAQIDAANAGIQEAEQVIAQKQLELEKSQKTLASTTRNDYKSGGIDLLSVIFTSTSFEDLVSKLHYTSMVAGAHAKAINDAHNLQAELNNKRNDLQNSLQTLNAEKEQQQSLLVAQQSQKDELDKRVARAQAYFDSLDADTQGGLTPSGGGDVPHPDAGGDAQRQAVLDAAYSMIGSAYVWGACDPVGRRFDCSGLTMYCFGQAGISLSHSSEAQRGRISDFKPISQCRAGDLIWMSGHVGIYCGGGMMIDAGSPATGVSYRSCSWMVGGGWPA